MTDLESLAFRLVDLPSLRKLAVEGLQFEFADKPVSKQNWTDDEKEIVVESKIIAEKNNFFIYYIQTKTDSLKHWKGIAGKIIKEKNGFCLVCSHNPSGFKWVFSSLSKEFSRTFSETRHFPIKIKPSIKPPNNFVEFLDKIKTGEDSTATDIASQVSQAFDTFAIRIHDELTVNVFEALKTISEGIIEDKSNKLSLNDEALREIRPHIFTFLYRIIFILYAEDRGMLPVDNKIYHEKFSLKWIKEEWLLKSPKLAEYEVQKRLKTLFKLIELGSEAFDYSKEEFSMRSYYGRLFDREINSKLESWKISNSDLIEALSYLTRTGKKDNYFFLDYAALETRHLGAVYERLLELDLHVQNKKIVEEELEERKASGSYYTPKYIVDYIARNCVKPLIDRIVEENTDKQTQIEKILDLKILDPAMGSGHFIVGAVEYIAKRLCEIEFGEVTEQVYIEQKRNVVRRCIYGIDLNPLAVDLASLSLWLETLASEKPLSFLQSHLKCGNSLIGSDIESIFGKQSTLFESGKDRITFKKNIKNFLSLENLKDDTTSAVKIKLEHYKKMQSETTYKDLQFRLNCKTAETFGIELPILFDDYSTKVGENSLDYYSDEEQQKVNSLSLEIGFLHLDLEFPQVFYDDNGNKKINPGFDCIIGNPPYVRQETIKEFKQHMQLSEQNSLGLKNFEIPSKSDLSCYFYYHGLNYLKDYGMLGFIASDGWMSHDYGKPMQQVMLDKCNIDTLMRTKFNVFGDADIKTITTILQKIPNFTGSHSVKIFYAKNQEELESQKEIEKIIKQQNEVTPGNWNLYFTDNELQPKIKMTTMDKIGEVKFGKKTGMDDFFVLTKETIRKYGISDEYRKPVISGDIHEGLLRDNDTIEYLLDVDESKRQLMKSKNGKKILKYIEKGENTKVIPKRGNDKTPCIISELSSVKGHNPWYSLKLKNPPSIFLGIFAHKQMKIYENNGNFYARNNFAFFTPTNEKHTHAFLAYLSSSWFSLHLEKYGHIAGGGALQFLTTDYKNSPVPDFTKLSDVDIKKLNQAWKNYRDDFDVKELDNVVLEVLGFKLEEQDNITKELNDLILKRTG